METPRYIVINDLRDDHLQSFPILLYILPTYTYTGCVNVSILFCQRWLHQFLTLVWIPLQRVTRKIYFFMSHPSKVACSQACAVSSTIDKNHPLDFLSNGKFPFSYYTANIYSEFAVEKLYFISDYSF